MSVRQFQDTNTAVYKVQSAGAAYNLTLPFEPDMVEWWNYTKFGTDANNISGVWVNGMPAGDALVIARGTTDLTSTLEATNGLTQLADGTGFADNHRIPTAISAVGVVTSNGHGLTNGQFVRALDFRSTPVAKATGMYGLNNRVFQVSNVAANTFQLFEPYTNFTVGVDLSAEVAFVSNGVAQFTLIGQDLYTQNPEPVFRVTLGTAIMGADNDVIYIRATKANLYSNLGIL